MYLLDTNICVALLKHNIQAGEIDAIIGAVARSRQDTLVTNNTRYFINISGLQLENWLEP